MSVWFLTGPWWESDGALVNGARPKSLGRSGFERRHKPFGAALSGNSKKEASPRAAPPGHSEATLVCASIHERLPGRSGT